MRIISLLPSATEILYSLNSDKEVVGISEECNYPSLVKEKPIVSFCLVNQNLSSKYIDIKVARSLEEGREINRVNEDLFISLKPDLVITQELCKVCAITPNNIQKTLQKCSPPPNVLALHPHSIKDILEDILKIGKKIGKEKIAELKVKSLKQKISSIKEKTKVLKNKPKVYCMEWLDPPYNGGHWVPEQVEIAGGRDEISTRGVDSSRILWQQIVNYDPEIIILMPCGFSIKKTKKELLYITQKKQWLKLSAVKNNKVYLVNGPAYFNCSGPRIVKGIELLAAIIHPEIFSDKFSSKDCQML